MTETIVEKQYRYTSTIDGVERVFIGTDPAKAAAQFFRQISVESFADKADVRDLSHRGNIDERGSRYSAFVGRYIGRGKTEGRRIDIVVNCL